MLHDNYKRNQWSVANNNNLHCPDLSGKLKSPRNCAMFFCGLTYSLAYHRDADSLTPQTMLVTITSSFLVSLSLHQGLNLWLGPYLVFFLIIVYSILNTVCSTLKWPNICLVNEMKIKNLTFSADLRIEALFVLPIIVVELLYVFLIW